MSRHGHTCPCRATDERQVLYRHSGCLWRIIEFHMKSTPGTDLPPIASISPLIRREGSAENPCPPADEATAPDSESHPTACAQSLGNEAIPARFLVIASQPTTYPAGCRYYPAFDAVETPTPAQAAKVPTVVFYRTHRITRTKEPFTRAHPCHRRTKNDATFGLSVNASRSRSARRSGLILIKMQYDAPSPHNRSNPFPMT